MTEQIKSKKKSKLTLNSVGLILLVVVVVANIYVWKARTAGEVQAADLSGNITMVQVQIRGIPEPADDLEARLEEVKDELTAMQEGFPATVDRNAVIDYVLKVAADCGVQILPLVSEGWIVENIGQSYRVLSITATAEGSLANVKSFISNLQSGQYPTLTIPELSIERIGAAAISETESEMQVTAEMRIGIYTLSSAPGEGKK